VKKLVRFLKESKEEFKKVTWPNRTETMRLTAYVLGVSLGVAVFVWGVDLLFRESLSLLLGN